MQNTRDNTLVSHAHGRMRRVERVIEKGHLQAAVKHGIKMPSYPNEKTGAPRWQYKVEIGGHPGWWLVFVTDVTPWG